MDQPYSHGLVAISYEGQTGFRKAIPPRHSFIALTYHKLTLGQGSLSSQDPVVVYLALMKSRLKRGHNFVVQVMLVLTKSTPSTFLRWRARIISAVHSKCPEKQKLVPHMYVHQECCTELHIRLGVELTNLDSWESSIPPLFVNNINSGMNVCSQGSDSLPN